MTTETKNKLDQLLGKEFVYKKKATKILRYKQLESGLITIFTSTQTHNLYEGEIDNFINKLASQTQVATVQPKSSTQPVQFNYQKSETHIKLEESLIAMIDKVYQSSDKDTLAQASTLCNVANTMINLEKQHLNFLKTTNQI